MTNMTAKVQIKNDTINSFGGIFFAIDQFRASRLAKLVNNTLGSKGLNARFKFSDTLENMASISLSGGEVLEDVNFFRTFYIRAMGCQKLEKRIAAVHLPPLRQAAFVSGFPYGFLPLPIRLGGGTCALPSAKHASGGRATFPDGSPRRHRAALRHPPEAMRGCLRKLGVR